MTLFLNYRFQNSISLYFFRRRRPSYYGNIFMCDNEEVDNALQKLYGDPNIGRMPVGFDSFSEGLACLRHMGVSQREML